MPPRALLKRLGVVGSVGLGVLVLGACARPGSTGGGTPTAAVRVLASPTVSRPASPSAVMPTVAAIATPTAAAPPPPTVAPTVPAPSGTVPGQKYVVKEGDTLADIANSFGVTVADLIAANNLKNPDVIIVGQELIIPGR